MWRDAMKNSLLQTRFPHQANPSLREVTNAAVKQSTGSTARAKSKITLLDQAGSQSAHRCISCNGRTNDATSDHENIERECLKKSDGFAAIHGISMAAISHLVRYILSRNSLEESSAWLSSIQALSAGREAMKVSLSVRSALVIGRLRTRNQRASRRDLVS